MEKIVIILSAGKDTEKLHYSYIAGGNVNGIGTLKIIWQIFYKTKICIYHVTEQPHSLISEK